MYVRWKVYVAMKYHTFIIFMYSYCTSEERLHDFNVKVLPTFNPSNPNAEAGALCAHHAGAAGDIATVTCTGKPRGSFVMIQIPGDDEMLVLCEVDVHPTFENCEYLMIWYSSTWGLSYHV